MNKLLKYEFIRKKMTYFFGLAILVAIEAIMLIKYYRLDETLKSFKGVEYSLIVQGVLAVGFLIAYIVGSIQFLWKDMFHKEGVMLFLTPQNGHKIIGSKLIMSIFEAVVFIGLWVGIFKLNLALTHSNMSAFFNVDFQSLNGLNPIEVIKIIFNTLLALLQLSLIFYLAMALFKSVFTNMRFKGLIVLGMGVFFMFLVVQLDNLVSNSISFDRVSTTAQLAVSSGYDIKSMIFNIVLTAALYFGTVFLVDKKINL